VSLLAEVLLAIVALSLVGSGIFAADPITTPRGSQTRAGKLHSLFGVLAVLGIPIAATAVDLSLRGNPLAASIQEHLPYMSLMVWFGLLVMMSAFVFFGVRRIPVHGSYLRGMAHINRAGAAMNGAKRQAGRQARQRTPTWPHAWKDRRAQSRSRMRS
jgi:hypothetical protein